MSLAVVRVGPVMSCHAVKNSLSHSGAQAFGTRPMASEGKEEAEEEESKFSSDNYTTSKNES